MSPYRVLPAREHGVRWGATLLVVLLTWPARRRRARNRADLVECRLAVLRCWNQIRDDAGFLYTPRCVCGAHAPEIDPKGKATWRYVDPRKARPFAAHLTSPP